MRITSQASVKSRFRINSNLLERLDRIPVETLIGIDGIFRNKLRRGVSSNVDRKARTKRTQQREGECKASARESKSFTDAYSL
jgi:hypothetical protein